MKRKFVFIVLSEIILLAILLIAIRIKLNDPTKNALWYIKTSKGEEYMCWNGGCGYSFSDCGDKKSPCVVYKSKPSYSEITTSKRILKYPPSAQEIFSPLHSFLLKDGLLFFTLVEEKGIQNGHIVQNWTTYSYDLKFNVVSLIRQSAEPEGVYSIEGKNLVLSLNYGETLIKIPFKANPINIIKGFTIKLIRDLTL